MTVTSENKNENEKLGIVRMGHDDSEVTVRMPTVSDLIAAEIELVKVTTHTEQMVALVALCCEVEIEDVEEWPINEYYKVINIIADGILKL